ncbi:chemotaxis protein CheW [Microvirga brassicacearum]|uniref:Chemotaxis protein CheW n=1 Tax=Microvirga brassicacearum TaxID=2580413 RepID=A0A5N3PGJ3_9HYPH|nr:chemotaxis protein CheW [Microvirga brassicacearum]KAB0268715.1 chemotaxis protein CheW [Microvirga brassicacearum]
MASLQILLFDVRGTRCAIRQGAIREILPLPRLWRPPSLPRPLAGFFNLGGSPIAVVRLDILFGLDESKPTEDDLYSHMMLVQRSGTERMMAFLVDRVVDLTHVDDRHLSPVGEAGAHNGCVEAEIDVAGQLVHLLSLEKILFAEERQTIAALERQAQVRLSEWAVAT